MHASFGSRITFVSAIKVVPEMYFKEKGYWENTLSYERVANFMEQVRLL